MSEAPHLCPLGFTEKFRAICLAGTCYACLTDRIAALLAENADMKSALDAQERDASLADGNLWRFWSRKAREQAAENERLRGALTEISGKTDVDCDEAPCIARAALKGETP